jgi:Icc-related predicted phosphoesterase
MAIAALYDIHGNLPALEAVLRDVRQADVDLIVVGGDVVPGPMVRDTLQRLLTLDVPVRFIHGNGEVAVLTGKNGRRPAGLVSHGPGHGEGDRALAGSAASS